MILFTAVLISITVIKSLEISFIFNRPKQLDQIFRLGLWSGHCWLIHLWLNKNKCIFYCSSFIVRSYFSCGQINILVLPSIIVMNIKGENNLCIIIWLIRHVLKRRSKEEKLILLMYLQVLCNLTLLSIYLQASIDFSSSISSAKIINSRSLKFATVKITLFRIYHLPLVSICRGTKDCSSSL